MKVVESGYKLDLHIHSIYSNGKDHGKVSYNNLDNIETLIQKLNEEEVQICAITDHDAFNFEIYKALKECENKEHSIVKVFPGVEFSVEFEGEKGNVVVHVIAIFDDYDDTKIRKIGDILKGQDGKPAYDCNMSFSEEKFLSILRNIELDTILIAHQKASLTSKDIKKSDANTVGNERFMNFLFTDYFEAYEFKNKKNEIFNKNYIFNNGIEEELRFITGSDCHDWRYYPKENEKDKSDFNYTYVKCLPTFKGLVMAMTDYRRIKTVNSFFNTSEQYLSEIKLSINGEEKTIPMSKGLNVIIGDNSIGKSLLLHKLTNYVKKKDKRLKQKVINGYEKYLKDNNIEINSYIDDANIFGFDMQGEVREKFELETLNSDEFLRHYYPSKVNPDAYIEIVERELKKIYKYLTKKFDLEKKENSLGCFKLISDDIESAESLTFVGIVKKNNEKYDGVKKVSTDISSIIEKIISIKGSKWITDEDLDELNSIIYKLQAITDKYNEKANIIDIENNKIGIFQSVIRSFKEKYQQTITDTQKKISNFTENKSSAINNIVELIVSRDTNIVPDIYIEKTNTDIQINRVFDYEFVSRLNTISFDTNYIYDLFKRTFKNDVKKNILDMTIEELADALPHYDGYASGALNELMKRIDEIVKKDFDANFAIIQEGMDRTQELSAGLNSKIYFDLLSYENDVQGIYLIDQPEDNISQKAIHEYLLNRFKAMGERRQVIFVTHNPQFIVNLDVDNVIFLGKENDKILIKSGALEYKSEEYSILDIISSHIEGGLDTLKRRWKRYEKNNNI